MSGFFNKDYLNFPGFPEFGSQTFIPNNMGNTPLSNHVSAIGLDSQPFFINNTGLERQSIISSVEATAGLETQNFFTFGREAGLGTQNFFTFGREAGLETQNFFTFEREVSLSNHLGNLTLHTPFATQNQISVFDYISDQVETHIGLERQVFFQTQLENPNVETQTLFPQHLDVAGLKLQTPSSQMENTAMEKQPRVMKQTETFVLETSPPMSKQREEIQPQKPRQMEDNGLDRQSRARQLISEDLHRKDLCRLAQIINCRIKEAKLELVRMLPEEPNPMDEVLVVAPISSYQLLENERIPPKKRTPTEFAGKLPLNFNIPREFLIIYAMEEGVHQALDGNQKLPWFPFYKRIDGWNIERKRRTDGRYDTYYLHEESKVQFRSVKEVTKFILNNTYPSKPQMMSGKKRKSGEDPLAQGSGRKRKTSGHREASPDFVEVKQGGEVVRYLKGSSSTNFQDLWVENMPVGFDFDSEETESDEC